MTESDNEVVAPAAASPAKTPKKAKATKRDAKHPAKTVTHPPASEMVLAAVTALDQRKGSSLQAIKKYITTNYQCDLAKLNIFLRKALINGVERGILFQTKGSGAKGSFRLQEQKPRKKKITKKQAAEKKAKKLAAKAAAGAEATTPSKTAVKKLKKPVKKPKTPVKKLKTPIKKTPVKKLKTPVKKTPVKKIKTPVKKTPVKKLKTPVKKLKTPVKKLKTPTKTASPKKAAGKK
ncbi:histone H1-gamma, late-like [Ochlerotatus camptorhynchus]|uniref:histone H1-gamma, late-like n=1 Tax=Ochlerotatus camptorhynchus TaxID=644619 RepID=UPI0031E3DB43